MRRLRILFLLLLLGVFLTGCTKKADKDGEQVIYALSPSGTSLVAVPISFNSYDTDGRIGEILEALRKSEKGAYEAAVSDRSFVFSWRYDEDGTLYLYNYTRFASQETGLTGTLKKAAIVKSFCEMKQINRVVLSSEDSGEDAVYTADSFFDRAVPDGERIPVTLYFADENRTGLIPSRTFLLKDGSRSDACLILMRLIEGPNELPGIAVIPPATKIRSVSVSNGCCYVDLSEEFLSYLNAVQASYTVYSIVNSLCELSAVNEVAITVEGRSDYFYMELPMDGHYTYRSNLVISK